MGLKRPKHVSRMENKEIEEVKKHLNTLENGLENRFSPTKTSAETVKQIDSKIQISEKDLTTQKRKSPTKPRR